MRKWAIPLTFMGLGGLGAFLLAARGRKWLRQAAEETPAQLAAWNEAAREELKGIQQAVHKLEQKLVENS